MRRLGRSLGIMLVAAACGDDGGSGSATGSATSAGEGTGSGTQGAVSTSGDSTAAGSEAGSEAGNDGLLTTGEGTSTTTEGDTVGLPTDDKVPCDLSTVTCDEAPPTCEGLQAPQIVDGCYTQACIPFTSCEEVAYFSCDECDLGETCVRFSSCGGDACTFVSACLPDPGAAVVNCATAGDALCGTFGPGFACYDEATGPYCCTGDAATCGHAG